MNKQPQFKDEFRVSQSESSPYLIAASMNISLDIQPDSLNVYLHPSYANTFVMIQNNKSQSYVPIIYIKHVNHKGLILKQRCLGKLDFIKMKMMTEKHVIFEAFNHLQKNFSIIQWNLQNDQIIKVKCGSVWYNQLFLFSQTKLICAIQRLNKNSDYLSSTSKLYVTIKYFKFPLLSQNDEPLYNIQQNECLSFYDQAKRFNYHSGIYWAKRRHEGRYQHPQLDYCLIHILDLREQQKKIRGLRLRKFYKNKVIIESPIIDFWQIRRSVFYVQFRNQINTLNLISTKQHDDRSLSRQKYNEFIWDRKQKTLRKLYLLKTKLAKDNDYVIQFSNGLRSLPKKVLRNKKQRNIMNSYRLQSSSESFCLAEVIHINVDTEKVICVERSQNKQLNKINNSEFLYPQYDHFSYVRIQKLYNKSQNNKKLNIIMQFYRIPQLEKKLVTAFMLTEMIQNCDQGLLDLVIQLTEDNISNQQEVQLVWKTPQNLQMIQDYEIEQLHQQQQILHDTLIERGKKIWKSFYQKVKQTLFNRKQ